MKGDNNNSIKYDNRNSKPIIIIKDSNSQLSESSSSLSSSIDIADTVNKNDVRLELVEISKGLIEILHDAGFTIEKILDNGPLALATILDIDN